MKLINWLDNHHYFDWCKLLDGAWRARIAMSPKGKRAEESVAKFHAQNPGAVVNLAQWRLNRARRRAA